MPTVTLIQGLVKHAGASYSDEELEQIKKAAYFAEEKLRTVVSYGAEDAFKHNIDFAKTVVDLKLGPTAVVTALLHNIPYLEESTAEIKKIFGGEVAGLVEEINNVHQLFNDSNELGKRIFLSMTRDIGLTLIEMAHMLQDLKRLKQLPIERQKRVLAVAKEIYAPMAAKLGVYHLKAQYEDLLLKYNEPQVYWEVCSYLRKGKRRRERRIRGIRRILEKELAKAGIDARIESRIKHINGIYEKMKRKKAKLNEIYDINAVRVITKTTRACYEAVGIIHAIWKPIDGEFDDYIAKPKENMYQSIHTAVMGPDKEPLEIQIRTEEMHSNAEFGIAAHWRYKGAAIDGKHDKKLAWLKQIIQWQRENKALFTAQTKTDFFENEIFAITPKGDIIELPDGATVLDFAYAIHGEIGHRCEKGIVNGKIRPFDFVLQNGDRIEIITSERQQPRMSWLNIVKTEKAKNSLIKALNIKKIRKGFDSKASEGYGSLSIKSNDERIRLGKCCNPVPGDEIVGFITTKRKISVHRKDCREIGANQKAAKIRIDGWGSAKGREYLANLNVVADDRPGILSELLRLFSSQKTDVVSTTAKNIPAAGVSCEFQIKVHGKAEVDAIAARLSAVRGVKAVKRI